MQVCERGTIARAGLYHHQIGAPTPLLPATATTHHNQVTHQVSEIEEAGIDDGESVAIFYLCHQLQSSPSLSAELRGAGGGMIFACFHTFSVLGLAGQPMQKTNLGVHFSAFSLQHHTTYCTCRFFPSNLAKPFATPQVDVIYPKLSHLQNVGGYSLFKYRKVKIIHNLSLPAVALPM